MIRVLVVDDHPAVRAGLVRLLRSEPGFVAVGAAANAADGLEQAERSGSHVVLLDYDLPDKQQGQGSDSGRARPPPRARGWRASL